MIRASLLAAALLLPALTAQAGTANPIPETGADIASGIRICREAHVTPDRISDYRACNGFLAGIIIGSTATSDVLEAKPLFCIPGNAKDAAIGDAILDYLKAIPAAGADPAPTVIFAALRSAFPCR